MNEVPWWSTVVLMVAGFVCFTVCFVAMTWAMVRHQPGGEDDERS